MIFPRNNTFPRDIAQFPRVNDAAGVHGFPRTFPRAFPRMMGFPRRIS